MRFIAALNEVPNKRGPISLCFLFVFNFEKSNPAYLSEKPFKCVVRPRKDLINRFLWTYSLIKRAILTSKLQKMYVKTGQKN